MENLSFLFIAFGALIALALQIQAKGGRVQIGELCIKLTIVMVAFTSWMGIFVGPIGDARRYHQVINNCFAAIPPCGSKLHEQIWSLVSFIAGAGWGLVYGWVVAYSLTLVARSAGLSTKSPLIMLLYIYAAYQVGNGMAEGSFFLLLFFGVISAQIFMLNASTLAFFAAVVGHIGNAPFLFYLLRFPRRLPVVFLGSGLVLILIALVFNARLNDLFSIVGKAGALISHDVAMMALENKLRVSIRDAETSYANHLLSAGFPYTYRSFILAIVYYLAPILTGGSIVNVTISALSTIYSFALIWLSRSSFLLFAIVVLSVVIFAPASFTPGIGLRHKVPVFLFLLMAHNPVYLKELVWRKLR